MRLEKIPLNQIAPPPFQPRQDYDQEAMETLASSIKELGLLQPIVVRNMPDGNYQLIAGSRRCAAARMLSWTHIPATITDASDQDSILQSLTENVSRADLNPIDVARTIQYMLETVGMSRTEIANTYSHDTAWVSQQLALLDMPDYLIEAVQTGVLGKSVSLELRKIPDENIREMYTAHAIRGGCTEKTAREWVRQATATVAARDRRIEIGQTEPYEPIEPLPAMPEPHCWICHAPGTKVNLETIPLCWHCQNALQPK
jgi:ParB family chromosome partitioning protein